MKISSRIRGSNRRCIELESEFESETRVIQNMIDQIERSGNIYAIKAYSISNNGFTIDLRIAE